MRPAAAVGVATVLAACHASTGDAPDAPDAAIAVDAAAAVPDTAPPPEACPSGDTTPGVCPGRGLYAGPVTVRLSGPTPASIVYTLDGSEPTPAHGTRYERPVAIAGRPGAGVVVLQAILVQENTALARPVVHSYVFPEQVLTQPSEPPGAPLVWGSKAMTPAAYELDPAGYAGDRAAAVAGLRALPTVSVVLPAADLWNPATGIYMNP